MAAKLEKNLPAEDWAKYCDIKKQRDAAAEELGKLPPRETTLGIKCFPKPLTTSALTPEYRREMGKVRPGGKVLFYVYNPSNDGSRFVVLKATED